MRLTCPREGVSKLELEGEGHISREIDDLFLTIHHEFQENSGGISEGKEV